MVCCLVWILPSGTLTSNDKHGFPNRPEAAKARDAFHLKTTCVQTFGQGSFGKKTNVTSVGTKMPIEIGRDDNQILDPTMIWGGEQKQPSGTEKTVNLADEFRYSEEMFDYFRTEADIE